MRESQYTDSEGRLHAVLLPDGVPESDASLGIPLGPPSLAALGYPLSIEVELHNQLYSRRVFTSDDARRNRQAISQSIQGALKLDVDRIVEVYIMPSTSNNRSDSLSTVKKSKGV